MRENWDRAFESMIDFEGGYVNDPNDYGGETYKGISRNNWPYWEGWEIIDYYKKKMSFYFSRGRVNDILERDEELQKLIYYFYKENFWDKFYCDELPDRLDLKVFDTAVHTGMRSIEFLKEALNRVIEKRGVNYPTMKVDRAFDDSVRRAIGAVISHEPKLGLRALLKNYCNVQREYYEDRVKNDKSQEKFLKGWIRRSNWIPG